MRFTSRPSADTVQLLGYMEAALRRAIEAQQLTLDWDEPAPSESFRVRLFDPAEVQSTLALYGDKEARASVSFLKALGKQSEWRQLAPPPEPTALHALAEQFPNFSEVVRFVEELNTLSRLRPRSPLMIPPILLDGPAGIGKTAFSLALASTLGTEHWHLAMGHSTASFDLGGLDAGYVGGGPGLLTRKIGLGKHADPVILLDEIDRAPEQSNSDPLGPLFDLLEPRTACEFCDDGLKIKMDLSRVRWLATTNNVERLDPALRSRFKLFRVQAPTPQQVRGITMRQYAQLLRQHPWGVYFEPALPEPVLAALARHTPRDLGRALHSACARAAKAGRSVLSTADFDPPPASDRRPMGFT